MTLRFLLDTNIISEPLRSQPDQRVLARLAEASGSTALPSVVWHELVFGTQRLATGHRRRYVERYLRDVVEPSFEVLAYDQAAADWHGRERARLTTLGQPPSFVDGQIAATAAVRGLVLVSRNLRHFQPFEGLVVENWFE